MSLNEIGILGYLAVFAALAALSRGRDGEGGEPPPGGSSGGPGGGFPNPGGGSLGLRSNNPGNIVKSSISWQGKIPCPGRFECFESMFFGVRALAVNLQSYYFQRGLTTVSEIISRWAPPFENDTGAYIRFVAGRMGVDPNRPFEWSRSNVTRLVSSIIDMENGSRAAARVGAQTIANAVNAVL